jgi:SAM-dependent methyltransferase
VPEPRKGWRTKVVEHIYADHNKARRIKAVLQRMFAGLEVGGGWAANVGAGTTALHPRMINVDLAAGPNIDVVAVDSRLPFDDGTLSLVVSQEALEHIPDYHTTLKEVARTLRPGGLFYCQVPFTIGFHPGPVDCWRFSRQGVEHMFSGPEWRIQEIGITNGFGTGFYRICVEFWATLASAIHSKLYFPVKGAAAVGFYWLKWFDGLSDRASQRDRIPGGYYAVVERTAS